MRSLEDSLKMDNLEQYNQHLNLQFEGVPKKKDEIIKKNFRLVTEIRC